MYDLLNYKEARIEALERELVITRLENEQLRTYLYEIMDKDCPDDYKRVIKKQIFYENS